MLALQAVIGDCRLTFRPEQPVDEALRRLNLDIRATLRVDGDNPVLVEEARVALDMATTMFLPAALRAQRRTAEAITAARQASADLNLSVQERHLNEVSQLICDLSDASGRLRKELDAELPEDPVEAAVACRNRWIPLMTELRGYVDTLEGRVAELDQGPLQRVVYSVKTVHLGQQREHGLDARLCPQLAEEVSGIMAADVLTGADANCARWIRKYREPVAAGAEGEGRRRERRRRRA